MGPYRTRLNKEEKAVRGFVNNTPKKESSMLNFIFLLVVSFILILITAVLGTLFLYAGWNWGVVPTLDLSHQIGFMQAFWLSLFVSTVGGAFKSSVTSKD
jgi:uncharacterized membrane protein